MGELIEGNKEIMSTWNCNYCYIVVFYLFLTGIFRGAFSKAIFSLESFVEACHASLISSFLFLRFSSEFGILLCGTFPTGSRGGCGLGAGWKGSAAAAASSSAVVCMRLRQCALYVASFLRAMCSTVVGR